MSATDRSGANQIANRLRQAIRSGDLAPGSRLIQEQLAREMKVSRIPLREALQSLAGEGLVQVSPYQGMYVSLLDSSELQELYRLRMLLEPQLAPAVIAGCRPRDVEQLQQLADQMAALSPAESADERAELNFEFHQRIYALSESALTVRFVEQLLHLGEPYSRRWVRADGDLDRINRQHQQIVDALREGDVAALSEAILEHIAAGRDHVIALSDSR